MSIIKLESVTKQYGAKRTRVIAIKDISIDITPGEFIVIVGKSGSGKSTLLSLLSGLEKSTTGKVLFKDQDFGKLNEDELAYFRRKDIGIVFQHFYLMEAMTAIDNVEMPLLISGHPKTERRAWSLQLLKMMGLSHRTTHYPSELSGGERQRVGIARALANKASVIIADEPTGDLDSQTGSEIIELLFNLHLGQIPEFGHKPTIILVTHDLGVLRKGMRVITLKDGSITDEKLV